MTDNYGRENQLALYNFGKCTRAKCELSMWIFLQVSVLVIALLGGLNYNTDFHLTKYFVFTLIVSFWGLS